MLQNPHDDGWAILRDGSIEEGQRGYAFLQRSVAATWAPGDAIYLWVPGYSPPDEMPDVDPSGSKQVAGSQLEWLN